MVICATVHGCIKNAAQLSSIDHVNFSHSVYPVKTVYACVYHELSALFYFRG